MYVYECSSTVQLLSLVDCRLVGQLQEQTCIVIQIAVADKVMKFMGELNALIYG